jgi:hypothetical protein
MRCWDTALPAATRVISAVTKCRPPVFARLAVDMRVNRALIDINRGIQTGDGLRNFLRFSTSRLMKSGIVEHDEPVGQIDLAKVVGARKKFQNRTSRLMNPRIIECGEDLGRMVWRALWAQMTNPALEFVTPKDG